MCLKSCATTLYLFESKKITDTSNKPNKHNDILPMCYILLPEALIYEWMPSDLSPPPANHTSSPNGSAWNVKMVFVALPWHLALWSTRGDNWFQYRETMHWNLYEEQCDIEKSSNKTSLRKHIKIPTRLQKGTEMLIVLSSVNDSQKGTIWK